MPIGLKILAFVHFKCPVVTLAISTTLCLFFGLLTASISRAQPIQVEPPVTFRTLALGAALEGVFYEDRPGHAVPIIASTSGFSTSYVCPASGDVSIYKEVSPVPPETKPRRVPVAEAQLGKGGPWLVLITSTAAAPGGKRQFAALAVDDSWVAHPVRTIRVLNYMKSRARAAVKIGGDTIELPSGGSHIFPYPGEAEESWVQVAVQEENGWVLRSSGPKATFPKTRSTMVLSNAPPSPIDPEPRSIMVSSLVDAAPPPPSTSTPTFAQASRR